MRDFRELTVWKKAHELTLEIYERTSHFPRHECSGLAGQMRRAAMSVSTHIAEGAVKTERADFVRLLHVALGFANQLEYQVLLAKDLGFVAVEQHDRLNVSVNEVKKMLIGLSKTVTVHSASA
jgi:four helix bundle protein